MTAKACRIIVFGLLLAVLALSGCGELPAPPAGQSSPAQIDTTRYQALKSQVDDLRQQGHDVSSLDTIIADIETWIAAGKVDEANLRIVDLAGALASFGTSVAPTYPPEPTLPPAPAFPPLAQAGPDALFADDFSSPGALSAWQSAFLTPDPGNMAYFQLRQDALYLNEGAGSMQTVGMVSLAGQESWTDYVYSLDIYPLGNQQVGAIFRYQDGSCYRFRYLSWEHGAPTTLFLERLQGDQATVLAQADRPGYADQQWFHLDIVAAGPSLTVYMDGQQVLQAEDSALSQGQVGVYALSLGYVYFDNVQVTSVR